MRARFYLTTLGIPALLGGRQACAGRTSSQQETEEVPRQGKGKVNLTSIIIPTPFLFLSHLILKRASWITVGRGGPPHFTDRETETHDVGGTCY